MEYRSVETAGEYVCRPDHGADWRAEIETFADEEGIDAAFFYGLGAVEDAEVWFYDQNRQEYDSMVYAEPLEVAACVGNVSWLEDERFAHTHAVLSRPDGEAIAGHLNSATVWAGELYVRAFETELERAHDEPTDLDLWEL
ncbi:DNA-binding protein [Halobacteriales archaeon QS_6_64_34]|nr:MAG: DNA-binding protein [Halobacteriales archaeon QS_6_64_34]